MPSLLVEILTIYSPHKLLQILGALSEYAKYSQSSTKSKKLKSLSYILDTMVWSKKPSHATVHLNICPEACCRKGGGGAGRVTPTPPSPADPWIFHRRRNPYSPPRSFLHDLYTQKRLREHLDLGGWPLYTFNAKTFSTVLTPPPFSPSPRLQQWGGVFIVLEPFGPLNN